MTSPILPKGHRAGEKRLACVALDRNSPETKGGLRNPPHAAERHGDVAVSVSRPAVTPDATERHRYTSAFSRPNLWSSSWQGLQAAQSQNIAPASLRFLEWATIAFAPSSPNTCFPTSEPAKAMRSSMVVWCSLMASRKASVALSTSSPFATALFQAWANDFVSPEADGAARISSTLDAVYARLLVHLHVLSRVPNRCSRYGTHVLASYLRGFSRRRGGFSVWRSRNVIGEKFWLRATRPSESDWLPHRSMGLPGIRLTART